jgi:hypothetical protein
MAMVSTTVSKQTPGVYVSPSDTGTNPNNADTDGDGVNDGDEVSSGTDPNEALGPPASLAGKSVVLNVLTGVMKSVPDQVTFTADTFSYGFSGNLLVSGVSYSYLNGTLTYYGGGQRIDLISTSETGGTYEQGYVYNGNFYVENTGTFEETNISLSLRTNWQRVESFDIPLSTDYWQIETLIGDSVVYNEGELNFIFDSGVTGDSLDPEVEIDYAGALPLNEDWQVVLDDIYAAPSLSNFKVELDLEIGYDFECELLFEDNGSGRQFEVKIMDSTDLPYGVFYPSAYVSAYQDARISSGGDMRIVHVASSRDLIFEYQPDGASDWTELARFNFANGEFQSQYNRSGSNLTGGLISPTDNTSLEIEGFASVATQVGDLEIAGIEIGAYTPPVDPSVDTDGDGLSDSVETNTWGTMCLRVIRELILITPTPMVTVSTTAMKSPTVRILTKPPGPSCQA